MAKDFLSVRQAAEILSVEQWVVRRLIREQILRSERIGYAVLVHRGSVERYARDRQRDNAA